MVSPAFGFPSLAPHGSVTAGVTRRLLCAALRRLGRAGRFTPAFAGVAVDDRLVLEGLLVPTADLAWCGDTPPGGTSENAIGQREPPWRIAGETRSLLGLVTGRSGLQRWRRVVPLLWEVSGACAWRTSLAPLADDEPSDEASNERGCEEEHSLRTSGALALSELGPRWLRSSRGTYLSYVPLVLLRTSPSSQPS